MFWRSVNHVITRDITYNIYNSIQSYNLLQILKVIQPCARFWEWQGPARVIHRMRDRLSTHRRQYTDLLKCVSRCVYYNWREECLVQTKERWDSVHQIATTGHLTTPFSLPNIKEKAGWEARLTEPTARKLNWYICELSNCNSVQFLVHKFSL